MPHCSTVYPHFMASPSAFVRHGGHIKYLYHQTSTSAGPQILRHGFRRGHIGWCGGGIYFALSKGATYHKAEARPPETVGLPDEGLLNPLFNNTFSIGSLCDLRHHWRWRHCMTMCAMGHWKNRNCRCVVFWNCCIEHLVFEIWSICFEYFISRVVLTGTHSFCPCCLNWATGVPNRWLQLRWELTHIMASSFRRKWILVEPSTCRSIATCLRAWAPGPISLQVTCWVEGLPMGFINHHVQWEISRILKWRYVSTILCIFLAISWNGHWHVLVFLAGDFQYTVIYPFLWIWFWWSRRIQVEMSKDGGTPLFGKEKNREHDFLNHDWLVVWNIYFSILYGNVIIPTDFHMFQTGWNHQPDEMLACPNIFCQKYTIRYNQTWQQRNPQFQL